MNRRDTTTTLFAIVAIACLANATQSIGDRFRWYVHRKVGENRSGDTLDTTTLRRWQLKDSNTVQVLYRFGTKSLSIDCSSARCLVVLSKAGEA